jgi:hypothetical protein
LSDLVPDGGRLERSDISLLDAIKSPNISVWQTAFKDKVKLKDGSIMPVADLLGVDEETFVTMTPDERLSLFEILE